MKKGTWLRRTVLMLLMASCMLFTMFPSYAATVRTPSASGAVTYGTKTVHIDASNSKDGYIMMRYTGKAPRIKVRIKQTVEYTYDLNTTGKFETFPLTEGSGNYTISVFENVKDNMYSTAFTKQISVKMKDANSTFLYPNQFCNFNGSTKAVKTGDELVQGITDTIEKVEAIYKYTVDNISYDYQKAKTVKSGYLPNVDDTLKTQKGICFDYSALMTSMLRTQNIPTKLVIGYAGSTYHAWISVYTEEQGWIDNAIHFDGESWKFMDPTFASNGKDDPKITEYINNQTNYIAKFSY
ncbi:MAG: transglutaminase domain-containing protein [Lachnoclostridium sp.]|nr:transglutaminase domain-containing protein [Lachnoclostridium sp.]